LQTDAKFQLFELSASSAQAYLSAAASGMMALTGIVFAMGFVMVQFSAIAYSPRLVLWLARDRMLFHALGTFSATFIFALATLAWVDRGGALGRFGVAAAQGRGLARRFRSKFVFPVGSLFRLRHRRPTPGLS
jgi:uncharacterized membrane protein